MRSVVRTNRLARAAATFVVGGLAVLVAHPWLRCCMRSVPRRLRRTAFEQNRLGHSGVPVVELFGGIWTIPIAWILDRLPRGWSYWIGAVCLGALPPTLTTWFVIFPLKGLCQAPPPRPAPSMR
jgi:hypothetical protein